MNLGKFIFDLWNSYRGFFCETVQNLAESPSAAYAFFLVFTSIALLEYPGNLGLDLIVDPGKMLIDLAQGIKLKERSPLVVVERKTVIHTHVRRYVKGWSTVELVGPPETMKPSELFIAELTDRETAIKSRPDPQRVEMLPIGIKPANNSGYVFRTDKSILAAGQGVGNAKAQMSFHAEPIDELKQEIKGEIKPVDIETRHDPRPHDREKTLNPLRFFLRGRGLDRVIQVAYKGKPLGIDLSKMMLEFFKPARAQDPVGENNHLKVPFEQIKNKIHALRMKGRFSSQKGYVSLSRCLEEVGYIDQVFPRHEALTRGD
jgi:hypothetical protein